MSPEQLPLPLDQIMLIAAAVLGLLGMGLAIWGWSSESNLIVINETPTSTVAEVGTAHRAALGGGARLGGPVEVVGTIECDLPLIAPYSETRCVAYEYSVTEENERRVGGGYAGGHYRRGREIETNTFDNHHRRVERFYVRDATGRIAVDPAGAAIDLVETVARYESYTGMLGSEREIWREEYALPEGYRVFVLGYLTDVGGEPLIARHPVEKSKRFLISHRGEDDLRGRTRLKSYGLYAAGGLSIGGAAILVALALLS